MKEGKARLATILTCYECDQAEPWEQETDDGHRLSEDKEIPDMGTIPGWCPLPLAEKEG